MNETESDSTKGADSYRLANVGELRKEGFTIANRPTTILEPCRVPASLRPLIPLAEQWGVLDDVVRDDLFRCASAIELRHLTMTLREHDDELDAWLAGPESKNKPHSAEYLAFSAMRMGVDCI